MPDGVQTWMAFLGHTVTVWNSATGLKPGAIDEIVRELAALTTDLKRHVPSYEIET